MQVWVGVDIHWLLNDSVICVVGLSTAETEESCCGRKLLWRKIGLRAGLGCLLLSFTLSPSLSLSLALSLSPFRPVSLALSPNCPL